MVPFKDLNLMLFFRIYNGYNLTQISLIVNYALVFTLHDRIIGAECMYFLGHKVIVNIILSAILFFT